MKLPYTPIEKNLKGTGDNEYCALGWLFSQMGCLDKVKSTSVPKEYWDLLLQKDFKVIYKTNDGYYAPAQSYEKFMKVWYNVLQSKKGNPEKAFMLLPSLIKRNKETLQSMSNVPMDTISNKITAIIQEWNVPASKVEGTQEVPKPILCKV